MVRRLQFTGGMRSSRGFTLLEVLLAFVIFALSFATVLEILSGSMRSTVRARDYSEAAMLAQSLMDMVGVAIPLEEGAHAGDAPGGYEWQLFIDPYVPLSDEDRSLELAEASGTELYRIELDVSWGDDRRPQLAQFVTVRGMLANRRR